MKYRIFAITSIFFLFFTVFPVFAEGDDEVQANHFYIEVNGGLDFPLGFFASDFTRYNLMSYGASFSAGMGLNFGGWMFGLEVTRDMWQSPADDNNLLVNFNNNILMLRVKKVLCKSNVTFLPRWLEFVPGLGVGVNTVNASYYTSTRAKDEGILTTLEPFNPAGISVMVKASLEIALWFGHDWIIPYLGADYSVYLDSLSGISFISFGRAYAGLRIYPASIVRSAKERKEAKTAKSPALWGTAVANINLEKKSNGALEIYPSYQYLEYKPESWRVEILDENGTPCMSWDGTGAVPQKFVLDAKAQAQIPLNPQNVYTVRFIVIPDRNDRVRNGQQMIGSQTQLYLQSEK